MSKAKKQNKVKPTKLQERTLNILKENPDMKVSKAMIKAGYSAKSAVNPKENFIEARGTQEGLKMWHEKLKGVGIDEDKLAEKYQEWLDAQKVVSAVKTSKDASADSNDFIEVPDYNTQTKVGEWLRDEFGFKPDKETPDQSVNIVVMPSAVYEKYGASQDTGDSS